MQFLLLALASPAAASCPYEPVRDDSASPSIAEGTVVVHFTNLHDGVTPTVSIDGWAGRPDGKLRFRSVCTHPTATYTVRARFDIDDDADGHSDRSEVWKRTVKVITGDTTRVKFDADVIAPIPPEWEGWPVDYYQAEQRWREPGKIKRPVVTRLWTMGPVRGLDMGADLEDPARTLQDLDRQIRGSSPATSRQQLGLGVLHFRRAEAAYWLAYAAWERAGWPDPGPLHDYSAAIPALELAAGDGDPTLAAEATYLLGRIYAANDAVQTDASRAVREFEEIARGFPESPFAREANERLGEDRHDRARAALEPEAARLRREAIQFYSVAAATAQRDGTPWARYNLGRLSFELADYDAAIEQLVDALPAAPRPRSLTLFPETVQYLAASVLGLAQGSGAPALDVALEALAGQHDAWWFSSVLEVLALEEAGALRPTSATAIYTWLYTAGPLGPRAPLYQSRLLELGEAEGTLGARAAEARAELVALTAPRSEWRGANLRNTGAIERAEGLATSALDRHVSEAFAAGEYAAVLASLDELFERSPALHDSDRLYMYSRAAEVLGRDGAAEEAAAQALARARMQGADPSDLCFLALHYSQILGRGLEHDYGRLDALPFGTDAPREGVIPLGERHQAFVASVDTIWAECRDLASAEFRGDDLFPVAAAVLTAHGRYSAAREWYDRALTRSHLGADVLLDIQRRYVATFESEGDSAAAQAARERFESAEVEVRSRVSAGSAYVDAEQGENDGSTIARVLRSDPALRRCREIAASRKHVLTGRTTLAFTVLNGGVRDARVVSDTTGDAGWQECARKAVSAARFPGEISAEVSEFPFVFDGPRLVSDQPSPEPAP